MMDKFYMNVWIAMLNCYIYAEGIQDVSKRQYFGKVKLSSLHDCDWWRNVRTTLQYLILLRKYVETMTADKLNNDLAFLIENIDINCERPILFIYGHKLITKTTNNIIFPQSHHCNSRTSRNNTVQIIDRNGPICQLNSRHATDSIYINKNTFAYNPDGSNNLDFFDVHCTTAYMNRLGSVSEHLFGKGLIVILPHLEQILISMNWLDPSLYAYRSPIDIDSDNDSNNSELASMDIPDELFSNADNTTDNNHDDDNDGDQKTDVTRITTELRQQAEIYSLICLGEMFKQDYFETIQSDASNETYAKRYSSFKNNVTALLGLLRTLNKLFEQHRRSRLHNLLFSISR